MGEQKNSVSIGGSLRYTCSKKALQDMLQGHYCDQDLTMCFTHFPAAAVCTPCKPWQEARPYCNITESPEVQQKVCGHIVCDTAVSEVNVSLSSAGSPKW